MTGDWLLFGIGFGNLAMLGWLAAVAAPLLIHLWSRRRYREMPWAAMSFLLAAVRKHSRQIQFEQWLLLAVRTLLILLVVLAVAEPYGKQIGPADSVPTHRVVVIDTSFSMAYRSDDSTHFANAKRLATQLVNESGPSDAFTVIALANTPRRLSGRAVIDRATVLNQIETLQLSQSMANLSATLDLIAAALTLTPNDSQQFAPQEVIFLADLQRATWVPDAAPTESIATQVAGLAEQASLRLTDVGSPNTANLAIVDLHTGEPFVTVDRPVTFDVVVRAFDGESQSGIPVELLVESEPVGQQSIDVATNGEATARFSYRFRTPGNYAVAARLASDRLEADNTRWLTVPVKERMRVLCVGGSPDDTRYLADALDPERSLESPIRPTVITDGELADTELAEFDAVFLSNIAQLTTEEASRLARYVRSGGGLAIFVGDRVKAESYNAATDDGWPLMPAQLGDVMDESRFGLDPHDYKHPIVAPFRGRERAGLLSTPISRYSQLELSDAAKASSDHPAAEIALSLPGGEPLIVTQTQGRGRVVLVATAGSMASVDAARGQPWTAWPAWPSFLPIVREVLAYAVGGQQHEWQIVVGSPIVVANMAGLRGDTPTLTRPDGRTATLQSIESPAGREWSFADTDASGIYTVHAGDATDAKFAVNVDTRESDLSRVEPQDLPPQFELASRSNDSTAIGTSGWQRSAWQRSLLWTALALVLIELGLAWRFGRGSA